MVEIKDFIKLIILGIMLVSIIYLGVFIFDFLFQYFSVITVVVTTISIILILLERSENLC